MRSTEYTTEELSIIVEALDNISVINEGASELLEEMSAELEERVEMESMEVCDAG